MKHANLQINGLISNIILWTFHKKFMNQIKNFFEAKFLEILKKIQQLTSSCNGNWCQLFLVMLIIFPSTILAEVLRKIFNRVSKNLLWNFYKMIIEIRLMLHQWWNKQTVNCFLKHSINKHSCFKWKRNHTIVNEMLR